MLTHANLTANTAQATMVMPDAEEGGEIMVGVLPLFHVFAMTVVMNFSIRLGAKMILLPRFELDTVLKVIDKKRPTLFPAVPTIYIAINDHPDVAAGKCEPVLHQALPFRRRRAAARGPRTGSRRCRAARSWKATG